jgi:hypothetical protein
MADPKRYRPKFGIDIRINPDVPKKAKKKVERCSAPGCVGEAETRVPKSRDKMEERVWLCRAHLKVHNESWDFFAGMSDDDIQRYCVESLTGHRPTWPLGKRAAGDKARPDPVWNYHVQDGNAAFEGSTEAPVKPRQSHLTKGQLDALAILNLEEIATSLEVRARYKELVKRFHPDANGGDRSTEYRLRAVIKAYGHLRDTGFVRKAS